jgi:hypothetical protein
MAGFVSRFSPHPPNMPPPPDYPRSRDPFGHAGPEFGAGGHGRGFYPLDLGRIWSLTFSMYRFRFKTFAGITLALLVPVGLLTSLLAAVSVSAMGTWSADLMRRAVAGDYDTASLLSAFPWGIIALSWVSTIVVAVVSYVVIAALTIAIMKTLVGTHATIKDSLRGGLRMFGRLLLLFLAIFGVVLGLILASVFVFGFALALGGAQAGLAIFLALIVFVALLVLFAHVVTRLQLALPSLIVEDSGASKALRRSWFLARGSLWRIGGYLLLFAIVAGVPAAIASGVLGAVLRPTVQTGLTPATFMVTFNPAAAFVQSLVASTVAAVFAPIPTIALTLLYLDIRWRHGEHVPAPGAADAAPTPTAAV